MKIALDETGQPKEAILETFAGENGLLAEIDDEQFLGKPGRKTTQTENEG